MELEEPCISAHHGGLLELTPRDEFDPNCQMCVFKRMLSDHDHLHLSPPFTCDTLGITDVPGEMVKCKCGSFHH